MTLSDYKSWNLSAHPNTTRLTGKTGVLVKQGENLKPEFPLQLFLYFRGNVDRLSLQNRSLSGYSVRNHFPQVVYVTHIQSVYKCVTLSQSRSTRRELVRPRQRAASKQPSCLVHKHLSPRHHRSLCRSHGTNNWSQSPSTLLEIHTTVKLVQLLPCMMVVECHSCGQYAYLSKSRIPGSSILGCRYGMLFDLRKER